MIDAWRINALNTCVEFLIIRILQEYNISIFKNIMNYVFKNNLNLNQVLSDVYALKRFKFCAWHV